MEWNDYSELKPIHSKKVLCRCSGWNDEGYQVAIYASDKEEFDYSDCPNDMFDKYVTHWAYI